jgi:hypothetical protein
LDLRNQKYQKATVTTATQSMVTAAAGIAEKSVDTHALAAAAPLRMFALLRVVMVSALAQKSATMQTT